MSATSCKREAGGRIRGIRCTMTQPAGGHEARGRRGRRTAGWSGVGMTSRFARGAGAATILLLVVLATTFLVACGDDDNDVDASTGVTRTPTPPSNAVATPHAIATPNATAPADLSPAVRVLASIVSYDFVLDTSGR